MRHHIISRNGEIIRVKLGKHAPKIDPRRPRLAKYLNYSTLPTPPENVDWTHGITDFGMMENDQLGDCTCAGMGHAVQVWTANASTEVTVADSDVIAAYQAVGGYVPGDESTDNGANLSDCLTYWQNTGIGGHKIAASVSVDTTNLQEVQVAAWLFGCLYTGVNLPLSAQQQVGSIWDVPAGGATGDGQPGGWGGHCTSLPVSGPMLGVITWGALQHVTPAFFTTYFDEAYAILSPDWIDTVNGLCPAGFDIQALQADLAAV